MDPLVRVADGSLQSDMPAEQVAWLQDVMADSMGYVEYGGGASTLLATRLVEGFVLTIESSAEWAAGLSENPEVRARVGKGDLKIHRVDIGPTGRWGHPLQRSTWQMGHGYAIAPLLELPNDVRSRIDLVLVDGRYRLASTAAAIAFLPNLRHVMVDDYADRPQYSPIESLGAELEVVGRAAVLSPTSVDARRCHRLLAEHLADAP